MNPHLRRAQLFLQQSRNENALAEIGEALATDPRDPFAHAFRALALAALARDPEALDAARQAVHCGPDLPYPHYVLACILEEQGKLADAERAIGEALRLSSADPDLYARLGQIHIRRKRWASALDASESGLRVDADHTACAQIRAVALYHLGRKLEAEDALKAVLAHDPENSASHAQQGWICLERKDQKQALTHFREALRLNPESATARQGMVEALRARYRLYRIVLSYFLWIDRFGVPVRLGILLGAWLAACGALAVAHSTPHSRPLLLPAIILYILFVVLTWTAQPLFDLLLRLDPAGRIALTRNQVAASSWVGLCLLCAIGSALLWLATNSSWPLIGVIGFPLLTILVGQSAARNIRRAAILNGLLVTLVAIICIGGVVLGAANLFPSALGILIALVAAATWIRTWRRVGL
ncbi:MAG: Tetratricopeptide 2 repeat protein [Capsulimonas sp.]|jgi:tetratricopeptide (TPR) repeat protein|nr:Tetratricopeptide 2 repeat protein [Capsulimonas sp.]